MHRELKPQLIAITREVSPAIVRCELTHVLRRPIDMERAAAQHADYEHALRQLGCSVVRLRSDSHMPDSIFVEDTAVVLDEIAIMMRPGAASRRSEISAVADVLRSYRPLGRIERSGTMDGGDVLLIGRSMFVGLSSRTNETGIEQMEKLVAPFGYVVRRVAVHGCLHLKSAVTALSDTALLINREWAPPDAFGEFELIDIDPDEPTAANVVRVDGRLLYSAAFPRTLERLEHRGLPVTRVDVSEIAKAEGAVTCCSLIFKVNQLESPTSDANPSRGGRHNG